MKEHLYPLALYPPATRAIRKVSLGQLFRSIRGGVRRRIVDYLHAGDSKEVGRRTKERRRRAVGARARDGFRREGTSVLYGG